MASANRNDCIRRLDYDDIPRMPEAGTDNDVKVLVAIAGIRQDADCRAMLFPCATARRLHHAPEPPAHDRAVVLRYATPHDKSGIGLFRHAVAGTNHRYLHPCTSMVMLKEGGGYNLFF